jgi:hypothetical protein
MTTTGIETDREKTGEDEEKEVSGLLSCIIVCLQQHYYQRGKPIINKKEKEHHVEHFI